MIRSFLLALLTLLALFCFSGSAKADDFSVSRNDDAIVVKHQDGVEILRYNLNRPADAHPYLDE